MTEKAKSEDKLFGLNKIFLTIKKQWGLRTAKQWLEQEFSKGFYLNDSTTASYFPYCWANDLTRLATEGLFFLTNYNHQAPKHLTTYFDDVIEFVSFLSNRQSGAVGLPNVDVYKRQLRQSRTMFAVLLRRKRGQKRCYRKSRNGS